MAIGQTVVISLRTEPLGRWVELRVASSMLDEFKEMLDAGCRERGTAVKFEEYSDDQSGE